jgi:hypothetical protein
MSLRRLSREPLLHFLVAGALLFGLYAWQGGADESSRHIIVDRAALLQQLQFQVKAFEPGSLGRQLDAMTPAQRQQLIDDYLREEVLYREAKALGLEQGDYVMRQRLVQKMSVMLEDQPVAEPSDAQLQHYLQAHAAAYAVAPSLTFTQVFIDPATRGEAAAATRARDLLRELNRRQARFNDSPRYSDRFPFLQNYVERTPAYVTAHFGEQFMAELAKLPVRQGAWQGPLRSTLGWHVVMVTARTPQRMPELEEIRPLLADDWRREQSAAMKDLEIRRLLDRYRVELR